MSDERITEARRRLKLATECAATKQEARILELRDAQLALLERQALNETNHYAAERQLKGNADVAEAVIRMLERGERRRVQN